MIEKSVSYIHCIIMVSQLLVIALAAFSAIIGDALDFGKIGRSAILRFRGVKRDREITIDGQPDDNFLIMALPESYMLPSHEQMMLMMSVYSKYQQSGRFVRFCYGELNRRVKVLVFPCDPTDRDIAISIDKDDISYLNFSSFTKSNRVVVSVEMLRRISAGESNREFDDSLEMNEEEIMRMIVRMIDRSRNQLSISEMMSQGQNSVYFSQPIPILMMDPGSNVTISLPLNGSVPNTGHDSEIMSFSDFMKKRTTGIKLIASQFTPTINPLGSRLGSTLGGAVFDDSEEKLFYRKL